MIKTINQNTVTVYEEKAAAHLEVSESDIAEYSHRLGIDLQKNPALASLIRDWILQPLPQYWFPCRETHSGNWFYFNALSGQSTWYHPLQEIHQKLANEFCFKPVEERQNPEGQSTEELSMESTIHSQESRNLSTSISTAQNAPRNQLPRVLAPLKRIASANKNESPMPLRGNQLSPITLLGTSQSQLGNENVRRVSFSTFKPAASVKAPDPSMSKESREGTAILNKAKNSGSNLSFTERLAAKKASRGALSQQTSIEPEPLNEKKRVQFDVNLKEVRTYTPEVSEGSKSSSSDFLDFICDPEQLKPFASSNYPVHFEDDRWNIAKKSFGTSKSNPIANGEMITSFNSSDEGEQLEDCNEKKVEVVETWFPAVGGDHSVKEVKSEPEKDLKKSNSKLNVRHTESSVANSATVVDQVVTEKNNLQMEPHQVGNSIVDPLPIRHSRMEENVSVSSSIPLKESPVMADDDRSEAETRQLKSSVTDSVSKRNLKSSTIDEIVSKTNKGDLKNLDVSSKGPQKVKLECSLVVKPGQNRKPVPILAFESSNIDEDGENSNVLAKGSPNDHQEPKSVHTAQKLTEESHSEVKLHQTKTFQVNPLPVIDLDTSKVNLGKDQVISKAKPQSVHVARKVTDESNSDMRFDPSVSPVKYPVPISERKNDAVASSVHVVQLIPEDNPEVKLNEGSATQMKLTNGNRPDVKTEMKLTHENHSETKLEDKSAMQLQMIHAKNLKEELSNKNKSEARQESEIQTETNLENESQMEQNLTHDTNAQIDTTKESKSEMELPRTNTRPLKSDNSFATIESIDPSKKEVLDGADTNGTKSPVRSQTNDDEASGENQLIADRNSFTRKEWLLMKEELECKLNDEKQRLERWFTEELALIKSKLESDLDQQKAQVIKEEVLLRMEDKLSQLIDIKKHDANVQTEQKVSISGVVKEARRELHSPVQDEGKRCRCEILEKQVARVEREMQLLKERKLSFTAKKSSSKKNGPVKAKRESWWPESDESSSALSSSFSEWQKPLKEPGWSFASKSSTPLQRARSFLSKQQMRQMHRKSWLDKVSTDESSDTPTSGISSAFSNGDWSTVLSSIHKISSDLRQVSSTIGHRSRSRSFSGIEDNCWMPSTSTVMANGRVSLQWPVSGSTAQRTRALRQWLQHNQHSPPHFL